MSNTMRHYHIHIYMIIPLAVSHVLCDPNCLVVTVSVYVFVPI